MSRNVRVGKRRTSVKLEPAFWQVLEEIVRAEGRTMHEICTLVAERAGDLGLTGAIRVFLLGYAWACQLEEALQAVPEARLPGRRPMR